MLKFDGPKSHAKVTLIDLLFPYATKIVPIVNNSRDLQRVFLQEEAKNVLRHLQKDLHKANF